MNQYFEEMKKNMEVLEDELKLESAQNIGRDTEHNRKLFWKYAQKLFQVGYGEPILSYEEAVRVGLFDICLLYTSPSPRDRG